MDRHDLYEICVQDPFALATFLRYLHGPVESARLVEPTRLAEDFCGTAAISREWVRDTWGIWASEAVCLDADAAVIAEARRRTEADNRIDATRLRFMVSDALHAPVPAAVTEGADIIYVGNFSIGEIHDRVTLIGYLRRARARLRDGGIFVCDTYGGESAWRTGVLRRFRRMPASMGGDAEGRIHYTWEQRAADPFTARVVNALHFRIEEQREIVQEFTDAFVYHWRLWSVPELRDAMQEAGFAATEFHTQLHQRPTPEDSDEPEDRFAACVVGRLSELPDN